METLKTMGLKLSYFQKRNYTMTKFKARRKTLCYSIVRKEENFTFSYTHLNILLSFNSPYTTLQVKKNVNVLIKLNNNLFKRIQSSIIQSFIFYYIMK